MLTKDTKLLTKEGAIELQNLQGAEKLAAWNLAQLVTYKSPESFQLGHSSGKMINLHTASTFLSITQEAPLLVSQVKNKEHYFDLMLIEQPDKGAALGVVSNFTNMIKTGIFRYQKSTEPSKFKAGNPASHDTNQSNQILEKYWILNRYKNRERAKYNLHLYACRYALPVTELSAGWQGISRQSLGELFSEVNTMKGLKKLKTDFDCQPDSIPHMTVKTLNEYSRSRSIFIDLGFFDSPEGHVLTVSHLATATSNRENVLSPVPGEKLVFSDSNEALNYIAKNFNGRYVDIQYRMKFRNHSFFIVPASWVREGMTLPLLEEKDIRKDLIHQIEKVKSSTLLYRILCKDQITMVANDVIIPSDLTQWWGI
jgi:hypothetical protein